MNQKIKLKGVRLSFVTVFDAKVYRDDKTNEITGYGQEVNVLLHKERDAALIAEIREKMKAAVRAKFGDKEVLIPQDKRCLQDGEVLDPDTGEKKARWTGYEGHMYLAMRKKFDKPLSEVPPKDQVQLLGPVKGADGKFPRLKSSDGLIYSGVIANVMGDLYAFDGKGKYPNRVNCELQAIQFKAHGEAFGRTPVNADDEFDDVEGEDAFGASSTDADDDLM